jgi:hypothetical protein
MKARIEFRNSQPKSIALFWNYHAHHRSSAIEFETKRQRNNYLRFVSIIINDGPAARPEWAKVPITFTEQDFKLKSANHNDAMLIEVNIAGWAIGKILVDNGSSADILFMETFEKMNLS